MENQEQEMPQILRLSMSNIVSIITICGLILAGYVELKTDISELKKDATENKDYRTKVELKLDKIIDNVTQIRVDAANQRVLDAESKIGI